MSSKPLVITVVGPTASGKSELAVRLAKQFNGEIISADSRQVYRGMDIGTGKVEGSFDDDLYTYKEIVHWGIDIVSPRSHYSVTRFQTYAKKVIKDISHRQKIPILCGGTGHWIDAVVYGEAFPDVPPNQTLRKELAQLTTAELFGTLQQLDPVRAANIDSKNPRRLIRALEIVRTIGRPVPQMQTNSPYEVVWIGIQTDKETLDAKIEKRLKQRLSQGMITEIEHLHTQGLSWKHLEDFGLEYKFVSLFLQNKISQEQMVTQLVSAIKQYAKRQQTWFKRNKDIHWVTNYGEVVRILKNKADRYPRG
jgi:tRNA dimethylallyltransferase